MLDLNTPESTNTCQKLVEIAKTQGYKLSVLQITIDETNALLKAKADNINTSFLQRAIYPEDIYNACERRNLNKADLERIADNLIDSISKFDIAIIYETKKYENIAKYSHEYKNLLKFRSTKFSALHDATAISYVKQKRGKSIKEFENSNCWFVNNSINRGQFDGTWSENKNNILPETIRADDLLNIMWLSNPQISSNISMNDLSSIGLSSLISLTLTESLPKSSIIRELEDNIQKYAYDNGLSDGDVIRLATRITDKQLTDIKYLNKLAVTDKEKFVTNIKQEAKRQRSIETERNKKLEEIIQKFESRSLEIENFEQQIAGEIQKLENKNSKINNENLILKEDLKKAEEEALKQRNILLQHKREAFIDEKVKRWRQKSWIELSIWGIFAIICVVYIGYIADWDWNNTVSKFQELKGNIIITTMIFILSSVFSGVCIKTLFNKYRNHSNIKAFKEELKIPSDLVEIE